MSASAAPTAGSSARSGSIPTTPTSSISWASAYRSTDGGKIWAEFAEAYHGDHHGLWIDPADSNYLINVNDGGANVSYDFGKIGGASRTRFPVTQFYNVAYDLSKPFNVYGSVQDFGTYRGVASCP